MLYCPFSDGTPRNARKWVNVLSRDSPHFALEHRRHQHPTHAHSAQGIREVYWIGEGAVLLVVLRLVPLALAGKAVAEGTDVYLFLIGMMLLSELGREHGVFDWLSSAAVRGANGSAVRPGSVTGLDLLLWLRNRHKKFERSGDGSGMFGRVWDLRSRNRRWTELRRRKINNPGT